jgi:hypothetical protein
VEILNILVISQESDQKAQELMVDLNQEIEDVL